MKRMILLIGILAQGAFADIEWPAEGGQIRLNNRVIGTTWRDGRPWGQRSEVYPFLGIPAEGDLDVDLTPVLEQKKARVIVRSGLIDVAIPRLATSGQASSGARAVNPQAAQFKREFEEQQRAKAMAPNLVASGTRYVADTEYIRAFVTIRNQGGVASSPCSATCEFIDWFGKPFASHALPLAGLEPGEAVQLEFFSMTRRDASDPKQSDKFTARVKFSGQSGPARNIGTGAPSH